MRATLGVLICCLGASATLAQSPPTQPRMIDMPANFRPSPDGRQIAFEEVGDLLIRSMNGRNTVRIVTHTESQSVRSFVWSPDAEQLAYALCNRAKDAVGPPAARVLCSARIVQRDGTRDRALGAPIDHGMTDDNCQGRLGDCRPQLNLLAWAPNGRDIVALLRNRPADRQDQIAVISSVDGTVRALASGNRTDFMSLEFRPGPNYSGAAVSPDSRFLIYGDGWISAVSLESGEKRIVLDHDDDESDTMLGLAPNGALVFARTVNQKTHLMQVALKDGHASGGLEILQSHTGGASAFGIDGKGTLYYRRTDSELRDVYTVALGVETGRVSLPIKSAASSHFGGNTRPMWSPDGRLLAYRSGVSVGRADAIAMVEPQGNQLERISIAGALEMSLWDFDWAPDQRSFLLNPGFARSAGMSALRVDRATGRVAPVGPPDDRSEFRRWLPDGRSFAFLDSGTVGVRDLESGTVRTLYSPRGRNRPQSLAVSPDGRSVAIFVPDQETAGGALMLVEVAGGPARAVATLPPWRRLVNLNDIAPARHTFSGDGRHLLYLLNPSGKPDVELWRVAVSGGEPERLGVLTTDPNEHIHRLTARRDGGALAFELIRVEPPATYVLGASDAPSLPTASAPTASTSPIVAAPRAEAILAPAFARAAAENKHVLIDFSAKTWCVPCFKLRKFLTAPEPARILGEHFVVVELTVWENRDTVPLNNVGAEELMQKWGFSGGIPFVVFADAKRRAIATSVSGKGFAGYPESSEQIDTFAALLPTVAPRMSAADRAVLVKWLRDVAKEAR